MSSFEEKGFPNGPSHIRDHRRFLHIWKAATPETTETMLSPIAPTEFYGEERYDRITQVAVAATRASSKTALSALFNLTENRSAIAEWQADKKIVHSLPFNPTDVYQRLMLLKLANMRELTLCPLNRHRAMHLIIGAGALTGKTVMVTPPTEYISPL
jgi:hypothetical protein